jgi:2-polyprenyl-6-methoxyphenol hydroxylase-like FAD-dependent oxidoreductase
MKMKFIAPLILGALLAGPATAAEMMHKFKAHGRMIEVHQMDMGNGTMMYAMSRSDLERLLNQRIREFSTYAPANGPGH